MAKINIGEQTDLFPEMLPNKKPSATHNKEKKVVTPLETTLLMLKMEYKLKKEPNFFATKVEEIKERQRSERRIGELEKRLLEILNGDKEKFEDYIKELKTSLEAEKNKPLPDPYAIYKYDRGKAGKNKDKEEKKGAPFCDKCQHYHWPEEPCSDWRE